MKRYGTDSIESWIVVAACSFIFFLTPMPMRVGGQLFVSLLDRYDADRKAASFPFALAYCMRSLTGPFAGHFGNKFGFKTVTLLGCLFSVIGVGGCFFAEDILLIDIFLGFFYGIGFGWSTALSPEIMNRNFKKHKAKANSIVCAACSLGAFIAPPLLDLCMKRFGLSGTFLILSAILLHTIIAVIFISYSKETPRIESHNQPHTKDVSYNISQGPNSLESSNTSIHEKPCSFKNCQSVDYFEKAWKENKNLQEKTLLNSKCNNLESSQSPNIATESKSTVDNFNIDSDKAKELKYSNTTYKCVEFSSLNENTKKNSSPKAKETPVMLLEVSTLKDLPQSTLKNDSSSASDNKTKSRWYHLGKSFHALWNSLFLTITVIQSCHFYVIYVLWTIIVDVARDKGSTSEFEVYFVMALSLSDFIGRLSLGTVTDSGYMTEANFTAFCFSSMGISCLVMPFISGIYTTMLLVFVLGFMSGANTSGMPGIVTGYVKKEHQVMVMASRIFLYAPLSFTMPTLIGYFREQLHSYDGLFYTLASICVFCCLLLFWLPRLSSRIQKR